MNPFDQFDAQPQAISANPFDYFDVQQPDMSSQTMQPSPETGNGFISRVKGDYNARVANGEDIANKYVAGDKFKPEALYEMAGQGAGFGGDVISEVTPDFIKKGLGLALHTVGRLPSFGGGTIGEGLPGEIQNLQQQYPRAADLTAATFNIGSSLSPFARIEGTNAVNAATGATRKGVNAAGKGAMTALEAVPAVDNALGKTIRPAASDLKKVSQANYAKAEQLGGNLNADFTNKFLNKVDSYSPQNKWVAANSKAKISSSLSEDWSQFRDKPMTLDDATSIDQHLTDLLDHADATDKHGILNSQGREILDIKNSLRESLLKAADDGHIEGGREGLDAYRTAVKDWAAQSQITEIQRVIDRAFSGYDNSATVLKNGFRNIANNPGRISKYPKDVQSAIKNAAKDGDVANILRTELGSRLISSAAGGIAGSVGGPVGALAGTALGLAGSRGSRNIAASLQMKRANAVIDTIASKSSMPTERVPLSQMIKNNKETKMLGKTK